MAILLLIIGCILFVGLVVIHELGHFLAARRNGVDVEEFGIGFPPVAYKRKTKKGFIFSLNWLPLGGFVRLKGEHDSDTEPGTFGAATLWVKTKIMAAGVLMNLFAALVLLMILAWVGMPRLIDNQFTVASDTKVVKQEVLLGLLQADSPAAKAGLEARDKIVTIATADGSASRSIAHAADLPVVTKELAGKQVIISYERDGVSGQASTKLLSDAEVIASLKTSSPKGYLGITPVEYSLQRSTWSAPIVAVGVAKQFTVLTFKGLGSALQGVGSAIAGLATGNKDARQAGQQEASSQVSGPVGIFVILKQGSLLGFELMLMIVALISLSLAIMNVLPIPALDGGKLFVTYVARLFRKRVPDAVENWVYGGSFIFLLLLIALITVVDVRRYF